MNCTTQTARVSGRTMAHSATRRPQTHAMPAALHKSGQPARASLGTLALIMNSLSLVLCPSKPCGWNRSPGCLGRSSQLRPNGIGVQMGSPGIGFCAEIAGLRIAASARNRDLPAADDGDARCGERQRPDWGEREGGSGRMREWENGRVSLFPLARSPVRPLAHSPGLPRLRADAQGAVADLQLQACRQGRLLARRALPG